MRIIKDVAPMLTPSLYQQFLGNLKEQATNMSPTSETEKKISKSVNALLDKLKKSKKVHCPPAFFHRYLQKKSSYGVFNGSLWLHRPDAVGEFSAKLARDITGRVSPELVLGTEVKNGVIEQVRQAIAVTLSEQHAKKESEEV